MQTLTNRDRLAAELIAEVHSRNEAELEFMKTSNLGLEKKPI